MHRFGRSAQQKLKDRWGGSFILATILALVGAWFAGTWLNNTLKGPTADTELPPDFVVKPEVGSGVNGIAIQDFDLYLVQVAAVRSQDNALNLARTLNDQGYKAMVADRNASGLYKVYGGLFMDATAANNAKTRLAGEPGIKDPWSFSVSVVHNPAAIPAVAMTGQGTDFAKALDYLTGYLYEAALWMEAGTGDTASLGAKGQYLAGLAQDMSTMAAGNPDLQPFANLAADAGRNATAIQAASGTMPGSAEQMEAMSGYLVLLDDYQALAGRSVSGN